MVMAVHDPLPHREACKLLRQLPWRATPEIFARVAQRGYYINALVDPATVAHEGDFLNKKKLRQKLKRRAKAAAQAERIDFLP